MKSAKSIRYSIYNFFLVFCFTFISAFSFSQQSKIDSLLTNLKVVTTDTSRVNTLIELANTYYLSVPSKAMEYSLQARDLSKKINFKKGLSNSYGFLGYLYQQKGEINEALNYSKLSLEIFEELNDKKNTAQILNNIGFMYMNLGQVKNALEYYDRSLKIREATNDKAGIANSLNNMGMVYRNQNQLEDALNYYQRSLRIRTEINDKKGIATCFSNIGGIYKNENKIKESLNYYLRSLEIRESINDIWGIVNSLNNIGIIYLELGQIEEALYNHQKALNLAKKINDKDEIVWTYYNLGGVYYAQKKYVLAFNYCDSSLRLSKEIGFPEDIRNAEYLFSKIDSARGNLLGALQHYKQYVFYTDSLSNEESRSAALKKQLQYEYEKKEATTEAEHEKQAAIALAENRRQQLFVWLLFAIIIGIGTVAFVSFRSLRITKRQKVIIEHKSKVIEKKQQEMIDSITYAKRLQEAILPPISLIKTHLPNSFVLYKPKDIVAGDFYWMEVIDNIIFIAAADCTGHGVPGAMVSVVCSNALNRTINEFGIRDTGKILDKVTTLVLETFEKSSSDVKDGMDISLLAINKITKQIQWSGANNPLWYFKNNEIIKIKADKQPIGKYDFRKPFTTNNIEYAENSMYYLFTDGFTDQFGGQEGKKYMYKRFVEKLLSINSLSLNSQKEKLEMEFIDWKGDLEQVDDITVIGIKI